MRKTEPFKRSKLPKDEICKIIDSAANKTSKLFPSPVSLLKPLKKPIKAIKEKENNYKKLWREDIKYYNQCAYFDGRKA
ncbi:MAG: hypothetical protein PHE79_02435 [Eubacteriales bacterium]|nr:hypothetical protein [Eubacteriales bacterium]